MGLSLAKALEFVADDRKISLAIEFIDATTAQLKTAAEKSPKEVVKIITELAEIAPNAKSFNKIVGAAIGVFPSLLPGHPESFIDLLDVIAPFGGKVSSRNAKSIIAGVLPLIPVVCKEAPKNAINIISDTISVTDDTKLVKEVLDTARPFASWLASEDGYGFVFAHSLRKTNEIEVEINVFNDEKCEYWRHIGQQQMSEYNAAMDALGRWVTGPQSE